MQRMLMRVGATGGDRRLRFIFKNLISKLHGFVTETKCVLLIVFSPLAMDMT